MALILFCGLLASSALAQDEAALGGSEFVGGADEVSDSDKVAQAQIGGAAEGVSVGSHFQLNTVGLGGLGAPLPAVPPIEENEANDIVFVQAKTSAFGTEIPAATWQEHRSPYFTWDVAGDIVNMGGYSFALNELPDEVVDTTAPSYQYPPDSLGEGQYTFTVHAQNTAGQWGTPGEFEIWVDTQVPVGDGASPKDVILGNTLPLIRASLSDSGSGIDVDSIRLRVNGSLAGADWDGSGISYQPLNPLGDGTVSLRLDASDLVGHAMPTMVWSFQIDGTPPTGDLVINERYAGDSSGDSLTNSAYVRLNLEFDDALSGVSGMRLWNDGGEEPEAWQATQVEILNWILRPLDGSRTVYVRFLDSVGNQSQVFSDSIELEIIAPDTYVTAGPAGVVNETSAHFLFSASVPGAVFKARLDNGSWSENWFSEQEIAYESLGPGNHYFAVKAARDVDDNGSIDLDEEDPTPAERTWTIGSMDPEALLRPEQPIQYYRMD
ncbi:MAG: hypothetical protein JW937_07820 [Candidatus Omnitrophica bacterium]|nr:hypothetical protein [Candidatus Omnitrophota bacterium]